MPSPPLCLSLSLNLYPLPGPKATPHCGSKGACGEAGDARRTVGAREHVVKQGTHVVGLGRPEAAPATHAHAHAVQNPFRRKHTTPSCAAAYVRFRRIRFQLGLGFNKTSQHLCFEFYQPL
jgi:hypothetical protein